MELVGWLIEQSEKQKIMVGKDSWWYIVQWDKFKDGCINLFKYFLGIELN